MVRPLLYDAGTMTRWIPAALLTTTLLAPAFASARPQQGGGEPDVFATPTPSADYSAPGGAGKGIAVFDPVGVGVDDQSCSAVGDLLRSEMTKLGRSVVPKSMLKPASCADEACAAQGARAAGVPEAALVKLTRLNQKVMVIATLVDAETSRAVFSDRVAAASLDDMDVISTRVARALVQRVPISQTLTADTATELETHDPRRQKSFFSTGVRVAGAIPLGAAYAGMGGMYDLDLVSFYEVRQYLIEASVGFRSTARAGTKEFTTVFPLPDIGGYYQFGNEDITPFIGGGVGLHVINGQYENGIDKITNEVSYQKFSGAGPAIFLGGGVNLLRSADVHLVGTVKYEATVFDIKGQSVQNSVLLGLTLTYARSGGHGGACCLW